MSIRTFRKAIGLLLVDIIIIIGIFVLQFRTDSNIIEKLGNLQVTLSKSEKVVKSDNDENQLANKFRVTYNGINFYCDEKNPVIAKDSYGNPYEISLNKWERVSDLSCDLFFTEDVQLRFELESLEPESSLYVYFNMPEKFKEINIPYSLSSEMQKIKEDKTSIVLNKKKTDWEIKASGFSSGLINIQENNQIITYSLYEETKEFTFDSIVDLEIANVENYNRNIELFKNNLINLYNSNSNVSYITEQVAVSYIAAMAERGRYTYAIESIPQAVKKSSERTYLSAPYFNTLEKMNKLIDNAVYSYEQKLSASAAAGSLDIFTVYNIAEFMAIHTNPAVINRLLQSATMAQTDSLSIAQATGIIQVFVDLYRLRPDYAAILQPVLNGCIDRIAHACSYENNVLTISENDTFLSVIQAIETGMAVMRYGIVTGDEKLQKAGRVIVNSYLGESASFDLRTLSNIYPLLAYDNPYYPHFEILDNSNGKIVWAWTCAEHIEYDNETYGTINISVDFPEGATHYVIIKGIPKFNSIDIYDVPFRTDYRFETYNSSGYVYKEPTKTLLLKSRHKKHDEVVTLHYN